MRFFYLDSGVREIAPPLVLSRYSDRACGRTGAGVVVVDGLEEEMEGHRSAGGN